MKLAYAVATPEATGPLLSFGGDFEKNIADIKAIGYDALELLIRNPNEMDTEAVGRIIAQSGLEVAAVSSGPALSQDGLSLLHLDESVRGRAVERLLSLVDFASLWGVPVCIGKYRGQLWKGRESEALQVLTEQIISICSLAQKKSVPILIEPQSKSIINCFNTTTETVLWMERNAIPNIGILYDICHGGISETSITCGIINARGRIGFVHCSDSDRLPPGTGRIHVAEAMAVLKATGYNGYVSMEIAQKPDSFTAAELSYKCVFYMMKYVI